MILEIFCWLCAIGLAVSGSLTFWPVDVWWKFYIPIVLAIAGFIAGLAIICLSYWIFGLFVNQKKEYNKVSKWAKFWFTQGVTFINFHAGIQTKIIGKEKLPKGQRFVLVCNHKSNFDPMILAEKFASYDIAYITKRSNTKIPWGGKLIHGLCYLAIDRDDLLQSLSQFRRAGELINNNACSIGVFPEGTRHPDMVLGDFHEGPFNIAIKSNVPLVIATVKNTEKIHSRFPRPTKVTVEIVGVIPQEELVDKTGKQLGETVHEIMLNNLSK